MDVLGDDQILQANLGQSPFEGIENNDLDIQQFEDFLNNVDVSAFFPEEAVGPAAGGNGGYNGPPPPATSAALSYGGPRGATQEMQKSAPMQHLQHPMHTAAAAAPSAVVLQQQQQQMGGHVHKPPHTYCHTQLPDSPPDSGSEPYSPPDGNQSEASSCNAKANMVGGMTALPQQMYPMAGAHSSTSPQHSSHGQLPQQHHPGIHGHPSPPHHPGHHLGKAPSHGGQPYGSYGGGEPPKLNHPPNHPPNSANMSHSQIPAQMIASPYSSMNPTNPTKKRKYSESPNSSVTPGLMNAMGQSIGGLVNIKQEPECLAGGGPGMLDCEDDFTCDMPQDSSMFLDGAYQVIKWQPYLPSKYFDLLDANMKDLPPPSYRVDADKGFNFSIPDDAFVCQKKNHFQVTVHAGVSGDPRYVKSETGPKKIDHYCIHFKGVKMESTSQSIKVEQSQSDRSKKPFHPVRIDVMNDQVSKVTVGRLHFSETTSNNMRKKGKPNPDQRYFLLVVALHAHSGDENFMVAAHASERIIVRASNPGQFDSDVEILWQKGHTPDSVFHAGRVGINTDRPDEALTVHGNLKLTGHIMQPSDQRVKKNIEEVDGKEQLKKVSQLKVYTYEYEDDFADHVGLSEEDRVDTGVLAQELLEIYPDAVRETGDIVLANGERVENFLVVNKDRLYMENVGAVKELCKLTDNLEIRIEELENMNLKLTKLKRLDSMKSTISLRSISSCSTLSLAFKKAVKEPENLAPTKVGLQNGSAVKAETQGKGSKGHPHHHHHHHHRTPSTTATKPEEGGICSNRFIQITITTLVLVMAFCLVSITTLYIMEKQKSHNGLVSDVDLLFNVTTDESIPPDLVTTPSPFALSNSDLSGPLMTDRCRRQPSDCRPMCCPPLEPLDDPGSYKPTKSVKPHSPIENSSVDTNKTFVYQVPINSYVSKDTTLKEAAQGSPPSVPLDPSVSVLGNNPKMELTLNRIARARRSVDPETAPEVRPALKASLRIVENNMTVSSQFCEDEACRAGLGGRYSYRLPVHQTFPIDYITIDFSVEAGVYVSLCANEREQLCASTGTDTKVHQLPLETRDPSHFDWSLPVGHYFSSTYYFRVTTAEHSHEACQMSDQDVNQSFAEYKLYFMRICENGYEN